MREIIPRKLWIGNATDARDLPRVLDLGISAIVDLAIEERPVPLTRELIYCRFPIVDGSGNAPELLSAAIAQAVSLIRKEISTLISCGAGMSRSPAVLAAALALIRDQSPDEALKDLMAGNPHDVSGPLWAEVKNAYNTIVE